MSIVNYKKKAVSNRKSEINAIVPAAGKSINSVMTRSELPDAMVPINGSPIISYIINDLVNRNIFDITIILNKDDLLTEKFVKRRFNSKCNLRFVYNYELEKGIGHSIYLSIAKVRKAKPTIIYLGDTIYKGALDFKDNFLVVSKKFEESKKWCFVEEQEGKLRFINRPAEYNGPGKVLAGIYFFKNGKEFHNISKKLYKEGNLNEIKDILDLYSRRNSFVLLPAQKWYDCGNPENYYKAKVDFLKYRKFNTLKYNSFYGYITKSGNNVGKIIQEINWYKNMPEEIRILSPRLLNNKVLKRKVEYSLEFYGYPSLADLFIYESMDIKVWKIVIQHIFEIIRSFRKIKGYIGFDSYEKMYIDKTISRIAELEKNNKFKKILSANNLVINKKNYINAPILLKAVEVYLKKLYVKNEITFIHGDLCMSNILFDPTSRIFKLIDPRGSFGNSTFYGDIKYDVAKLRHSFVNYYDFIIADLFEINHSQNNITLEIYTENSHYDIAQYFDLELAKNGYDLKKIKIIEALLFISMVSLHSDNENRQLAMYCTGLRLLNDSGILSKDE